MYSAALFGASFLVCAPMRTKKSPSGLFSIVFHLRNTGSELRRQLTRHTGFATDQLDAGARKSCLPKRGTPKAIVVLLAVVQLAGDGEEVAPVEALELLVEAGRRPEEGEPELAAGVLDPAPQHVEGAATLDLARQALQEAALDLAAVVLPEPLPGLGLGGEDEVDDVSGDEAEVAMVVAGGAAAVATGEGLGAIGRGWLADLVGRGVRPAGEQGAVDSGLEGSF